MAITGTTFSSLSITGTTATLNCTPPVHLSYDHTQIIYRLFGSSSFTLGATFIGTQGVAGEQTQTGLIANMLYEFGVVASDSDDNYSIISETRKAQSLVSISESKMFLDNAKILLANCATFQSMTNTSNATQALDRIYLREYNLLTEVKHFPIATLYFEGSSTSERLDTDNFLMNASISIRITEECSSDNDRDEVAISNTHLETVEKIINELKALQGVDAFLLVKSVLMVEPPSFMNLTDQEEELSRDYIISTYLLETGA